MTTNDIEQGERDSYIDELYRRLVEPSHNDTLIHIDALARQFAHDLHKDPEKAGDIAQDVVCECLLRMREGTWDAADWPDHNLGAFIRLMVQRRSIDVARRRRQRAMRDADYLDARHDSLAAWTRPDIALDERAFDALRNELIDALPEKLRITFRLVRDRGLSYEEVAAYTNVTKSAVSARIVRAQLAIRTALVARGIPAPKPRRGTRRQLEVFHPRTNNSRDHKPKHIVDNVTIRRST